MGRGRRILRGAIYVFAWLNGALISTGNDLTDFILRGKSEDSAGAKSTEMAVYYLDKRRVFVLRFQPLEWTSSWAFSPNSMPAKRFTSEINYTFRVP